MVQLTFYQLFLLSILSAGIGHTLLKYSRDGDLELQEKNIKKSKNKNYKNYADSELTTSSEAWERMELLLNADSTEVTWNTSMFVALISSLVVLALVDYGVCESFTTKSRHLKSSTTGMIWIVTIFTVFGLQDLIIRWKNAHRKHAATREKNNVLKRLQYDFKNNTPKK
jgi:hypothetical protein